MTTENNKQDVVDRMLTLASHYGFECNMDSLFAILHEPEEETPEKAEETARNLAKEGKLGKKTTIRLVESHDCDWVAIYVNGQLFYENHSIRNNVWLNIFKKYCEIDILENIMLEENDSFPKEWSEED